MIAERPDISIDAVYSQAEAARLLKVDRHTLRRWEKDPVFPLARPVDGEIAPNLPGKWGGYQHNKRFLETQPGTGATLLPVSLRTPR